MMTLKKKKFSVCQELGDRERRRGEEQRIFKEVNYFVCYCNDGYMSL